MSTKPSGSRWKSKGEDTMRYLSFYIIFSFILFCGSLIASNTFNDAERKIKMVTVNRNIVNLNDYILKSLYEQKKILLTCTIEKNWAVRVTIYFPDVWEDNDKTKAILNIKEIVKLFHKRQQKKQNGSYVLASISIVEGSTDERPSEEALKIELGKFAQRLFKQSKWSQEIWSQRIGADKKGGFMALRT